MPASKREFLRRVVQREIRTSYSVSETLECGHRYESLKLLADSLTANHRECVECSRQVQKFPPQSAAKRSPAFVRDPARFDPPPLKKIS
jgi:hypothetical protein